MEILLNGFSVVRDHWRLIFGILLIMLMGQILVWSALKTIFGDRLTADEYYSLGLAGWILPVSLGSMLWFLWGTIQGSQFSALIVLALISIFTIVLFFRSRIGILQDSRTILLGLFLLSGVSIFLRLVFVSKAIIPLYFDSAQHYMIIKNLVGSLGPSSTRPFTWPTASYYHVGFHLLTAFIISAMHEGITNTMLILGQMILAVTSISVFFIIKHVTNSNSAGIFAVLLPAFGWNMPAYAVNWGKYPALTSLAPIMFVFSIAYLSLQNWDSLSSQKYWSLNAILASGILISGFIHTRSLVIFAIAILAWVTGKWWRNLARLPQFLFVYLVIIGITLEVIVIRSQDVLKPLFDPYYSHQIFLVTFLILFLFVFAYQAYPQLAFTSILVIFLLFTSLFIPVPEVVPGYGNLTLLDRPFVEMILYLPLSLIGGLGLAGLQKTLQDTPAKVGAFHFWWGKYVSILCMGLVLINAFTHYRLYPSACCEIVSQDDLVAIDWMDKNLPLDARILISANELRVLASGSFEGYVSEDAGVWITPLISRATIPLPYSSDFGQQSILDSLCRMKANYIYVGEIGTTFDNSQIQRHPDWYKSLLSMPKAKVYQVIGCN